MLSISSGALPPGISLVSNIVAPTEANRFYLSGTPTQAGVFTFTAQAQDPGYPPISRSYTLNIAQAAFRISLTHSGTFNQGMTGATYNVIVSNAIGVLPTSGTLTVTETVPSGMTLISMAGDGWTCPVGGTTCTRGDALAPGNSFPAVTVTVNISGNAASPETNSVTVSGGEASSATGMDYTIIAASPVLSVSATHVGSFMQGQNGRYSVIVSNASSATPTDSVVTVTDTVPVGLTLVSMAGTGWNCPPASSICTRADVLAAGTSYPQITVTVNVDPNASSRVINQVSATGGGAASAGTANDPTGITPPPTALRFVPVTPCRLVDTRKANGAFGSPSIPGGSTRDFLIPNSACGIPATAQAYSLNVAVVPMGPLGYLTLWPSGQEQPVASTLNSVDGRVKSNAAIVPAGVGGAISVFASNGTNLILDINGYFVPAVNSTALAFYPLTPAVWPILARVLDRWGVRL